MLYVACIHPPGALLPPAARAGPARRLPGYVLYRVLCTVYAHFTCIVLCIVHCAVMCTGWRQYIQCMYCTVFAHLQCCVHYIIHARTQISSAVRVLCWMRTHMRYCICIVLCANTCNIVHQEDSRRGIRRLLQHELIALLRAQNAYIICMDLYLRR